MTLLPLAAFVFIFCVLLKKTLLEKRLAFLWAALIWAIAAVTIIEILSIFHGLTRAAVAGCWGLVNFAAIGCLIFFSTKLKNKKTAWATSLSKWNWIGICLTVTIIFVVGINAIFAAPNNWDSMTYHLPRVMHWIQNHSVEHYPTPILRQLYQPPGAEYLILHFQILAQSDQFANLIQWFSLLGSVITVSLLAFELGAGKSGQILAGLLAVTIPMAILQGTSTQNDLVVGFWLLSFGYFSLRLFKTQSQASFRWVELLGASLSLALALLTKGSAYIYAVPWLICFFIVDIFKKHRMIFRDLAVIVVICLAVNSGFYSRNIRLFGAPLSAGSEEYANSGNLILNGLSNGVRNAALHLGTPSFAVNNFLKEKIVHLSGNDKNNSWGDFEIPFSSTNEDIAGNPFHFLLAFFIFIAVLISQKSSILLKVYTLLILLGFGIFCAFFKWQLFNSRLHLPLFLLSMPVAGLILEKIQRRWLVVGIISVLLFAAATSLFCNERHPLVGKNNVFNMSRTQQYFLYRKFMALPYVIAVKYASSRCDSHVGLLLGNDDWEYPLWILLKKEKPDLKIAHVGVNNVSNVLGLRTKVPVVISELPDPPAVLNFNTEKYIRCQKSSFMSLYENAEFSF